MSMMFAVHLDLFFFQKLGESLLVALTEFFTKHQSFIFTDAELLYLYQIVLNGKKN